MNDLQRSAAKGQKYKQAMGELQANEVTLQVTYANSGNRWPRWLMFNYMCVHLNYI